MGKTKFGPLHQSIPMIILLALLYFAGDTRLFYPSPWLQNAIEVNHTIEAKQLKKEPNWWDNTQPLPILNAVSSPSEKPILTWTKLSRAVYYEIEFLSEPPENPNGTEPSIHRINFSREVFTNGYNPDFSTLRENQIYWRVRALDYDDKPLGVFSDAQQIFIDHANRISLKPHITTIFNENSMITPLYPVYSWIPIAGAAKYEVEILSQPPENPNGIEPSKYQVWSKEAVGFDLFWSSIFVTVQPTFLRTTSSFIRSLIIIV